MSPEEQETLRDLMAAYHDLRDRLGEVVEVQIYCESSSPEHEDALMYALTFEDGGPLPPEHLGNDRFKVWTQTEKRLIEKALGQVGSVVRDISRRAGRAAAMSLACSSCGVAAGSPCVTATGRRADNLHAARRRESWRVQRAEELVCHEFIGVHPNARLGDRW